MTSSSAKVTGSGCRLMELLTERLSSYGYEELQGKHFIGGRRKDLRPLLLAVTPPEAKDVVLEVCKLTSGFVASSKQDAMSTIRDFFLKTVRLKPSEEQRSDDVIEGEDCTMTSHQRVRRITELLLTNYNLRDEIYCQMMKTIRNTRSSSSLSSSSSSSAEYARAWLLMRALMAVALPSKKLLLYLARFIDDCHPPHPASSVADIRSLLAGTIRNGRRHRPITCLEFMALEQNCGVEVPVRLENGSQHFVKVHHWTTAHQVLDRIGSLLKLRDHFGFSLYVSLGDVITSLGSNDKIFDSIDRCESICNERNNNNNHSNNAAPLYAVQSKDGGTIPGFRLVGTNRTGSTPGAPSVRKFGAPWRFWVRKEFFAPWDDGLLGDAVARDLVYAQICRDHVKGEYNSVDGVAVSKMAAMRYFVEHGRDISEAKLKPLLKSLVPKIWLGRDESKSNQWASEIIERYREIVTAGGEVDSVKMEVILKVKVEWIDAFTKIFTGRDAITGDHVLVGVNSEGIRVSSVDAVKESRFIKFHEIQRVERLTGCAPSQAESCVGIDANQPGIIRVSAEGGDVTFESRDALEAKVILDEVLGGLYDRSRWALVEPEDGSPSCPGDTENVNFRSGDLVRLLDRGAGSSAPTSSVSVLCEHVESGRRRLLPVEGLKILGEDDLELVVQKLSEVRRTNRRRGKPTTRSECSIDQN